MGETLDIAERDDGLIVEIPERNRWWLVYRAVGKGMGLLTAITVAVFGLLVLGFELDWPTALSTVGGFYLFVLALTVGGVYREQVRPIARGGRLHIEQDRVTYQLGREDASREVPIEHVQMLQLSRLSLFGEGQPEDAPILPDDQKHELTLLTDDDLQVVGYGISRREGERAVEMVNERLHD